jgi:hypothetical protein
VDEPDDEDAALAGRLTSEIAAGRTQATPRLKAAFESNTRLAEGSPDNHYCSSNIAIPAQTAILENSFSETR